MGSLRSVMDNRFFPTKVLSQLPDGDLAPMTWFLGEGRLVRA